MSVLRYVLRNAEEEVVQSLLKKLKSDHMAFLRLTVEQRKNNNVIRRALLVNPKVFTLLPQGLQEDTDFILGQLTGNLGLLRYVGKPWRSSSEFMQKVINKHGAKAISYAKGEVFDNEGLMLGVVSELPMLYKYVSERLRERREFAEEVLKRNGLAFEFMPRQFKDEVELAVVAIKANPFALSKMGERFTDDEEIVLLAVRKNKTAYLHASRRIDDLCRPRDDEYLSRLEEVVFKKRQVKLESYISGAGIVANKKFKI